MSDRAEIAELTAELAEMRVERDAATARLEQECESHEQTVEVLQARHAETYDAFNRAMSERDAAIRRAEEAESLLEDATMRFQQAGRVQTARWFAEALTALRSQETER